MRVTVAIPATGSINLKLGKKTRGGAFTIWTSLHNVGDYLKNKCMPVSTATLVPTSGTLTCQYLEDSTYVIFAISGFNAIAASSDVEFVIQDVTNPNVANDNVHIDAVIETRSATALLNQGVIFDVFSPVVQAVTTAGSTSAFSRSVNTLGTAGV